MDDMDPMSRKLKALGALNLIGWTVAIPLLMVALVTPLIAFHGWPGGLPGFHGDNRVQLGEPGELRASSRPDGRPGPGGRALGPILPGGVISAGGPGIAPGVPPTGGSARPAIGSRTRRGGSGAGALPTTTLPSAPVAPAPAPVPAPAAPAPGTPEPVAAPTAPTPHEPTPVGAAERPSGPTSGG